MVLTVQRFEQPGDRAAWDERVAAAPGGHVLQSWAWGELKAQFGWRVQRLAVGDACAQVLYRSLPGGVGTLAYVPKGPLVAVQDGASLRALLDAIQPLAQRQRAICLKIEPGLEEDPALDKKLLSLDFRPSPQEVQPRRTILLDLGAGTEELLQRMKQKTRYNIRLAARKGVSVRLGTEDDLPAFYRMMEATARRDGFGIHTQAYYEAAHRLFVPWNQGCLLLAEYEGQLLAGLVTMALKTTRGGMACYMYGASSNEHRNLMAPYLLQWEAMQWAADLGCRDYDLWGVPDEDAETLEAAFAGRSDGLWGVYRFKRGFGGRLVRTSGAWDLVYAPLRYRLYTAAWGWYQRRRGGAD